MKRKNKNVVKDLITRKIFLKNEYKKLILKSIIQNTTTINSIRFHAFYKLTTISQKANISKQVNPCLLTGRIGGVYQFSHLSRQVIKKLNNNGLIPNIKVKS